MSVYNIGLHEHGDRVAIKEGGRKGGVEGIPPPPLSWDGGSHGFMLFLNASLLPPSISPSLASLNSRFVRVAARLFVVVVVVAAFCLSLLALLRSQRLSRFADLGVVRPHFVKRPTALPLCS